MEDKPKKQLTEQQKERVTRHARRFMRWLEVEGTPKDDEPIMPIEVIVHDDDGNIIKTEIH